MKKLSDCEVAFALPFRTPFRAAVSWRGPSAPLYLRNWSWKLDTNQENNLGHVGHLRGSIPLGIIDRRLELPKPLSDSWWLGLVRLSNSSEMTSVPRNAVVSV